MDNYLIDQAELENLKAGVAEYVELYNPGYTTVRVRYSNGTEPATTAPITRWNTKTFIDTVLSMHGVSWAVAYNDEGVSRLLQIYSIHPDGTDVITVRTLPASEDEAWERLTSSERTHENLITASLAAARV